MLNVAQVCLHRSARTLTPTPLPMGEGLKKMWPLEMLSQAFPHPNPLPHAGEAGEGD
jgi:hypothetical protein